jgi:hypothetical protein
MTMVEPVNIAMEAMCMLDAGATDGELKKLPAQRRKFKPKIVKSKRKAAPALP